MSTRRRAPFPLSVLRGTSPDALGGLEAPVVAIWLTTPSKGFSLGLPLALAAKLNYRSKSAGCNKNTMKISPSRDAALASVGCKPTCVLELCRYDNKMLRISRGFDAFLLAFIHIVVF